MNSLRFIVFVSEEQSRGTRQLGYRDLAGLLGLPGWEQFATAWAICDSRLTKSAAGPTPQVK